MAKASTVSSVFASRDALQFNYSSTLITADGTLNLPAQTGTTVYLTVESVPQVDFTSDVVAVEAVAYIDGASTTETTWGVRPAAGTEHTFFIEGNSAATKTLVFRRQDAGAAQSDLRITYDPVAHRWWMLQHDGTSVLYKTSPTYDPNPAAATWTLRRTVVPVSNLTLARLWFAVGNYNAANTPTGIARFDNLNPPAVAAATGPTMLARTAGTTPTWERRKLQVRNAAGTGWTWGP